ncbi:unnamed protein product [Cyprideis torosa]|uniref:Glutathione peroxidase n=1 Tax=Cyprideis torosa TaxID=163714 RepID=A0A7R8WUJ1_9CRUS|nr:unnamed protein product [Cyprideis torosa]CAG0906831.1 unnamed protein product [Cyprideis torosa]
MYLRRGEFVSIMGKSGSGKSTLLYILSTMDTDYTGDLYIAGQKASGRTKTELAYLRNAHIGFVFQFHYLLPEFTVLDNVMLPARKLGRKSDAEIKKNALQNLELLGIKDQAFKKANLLSGGQKQRVAIARALINNPEIIMGDEPTGNLDSKNSDNVFNILRDLGDEFGMSVLVVTHDEEFAARTDRIITLEDGRIISCSAQTPNMYVEYNSDEDDKTIYQFVVKDLYGESYNMADLKGKKVMIVNTASKCGLTPQYEGLQELYSKYKDKGLVIIGFPANNFLAQEPGTNEEISEFCQVNYGVEFPMMSKISVKGKNIHPVYQFLTQKSKNGVEDSSVSWNFQKYLIGTDGKLEKVISPRTQPQSEEIIQWIEAE